MAKEARSEAKQVIAPLVIEIHDVRLSESQFLEPVRVKLDGLSLGIID
jgi:hypothetical protein